jgi:hypothetical protein
MVSLLVFCSLSEDMVLLGRMLRANSNVIEEIDLGHNGIPSSELDILIPSLAQVCGLERLYLHGNTLSPQGAAALLQAASSPMMSRIQTMRLPFCCPMAAELQHAADLNRAGRNILLDPATPVALWPLVLERAGKLAFGSGDTFDSAKRANAIYHLLHGPATLYYRRRAVS